jgi:hypothetical protein
MSNSQQKTIVSGVGLLSDFHIMYYYGDAGVEVGGIVDEKSGALVDTVTEGIELVPNLKLRFSSREDAQALFHYPNLPMSCTQYQLNKYVIESSFEIEDESKKSETFNKIHELICNTVTGLRLLKRGYIDSNTILWVEEKESGRHVSLEWQRAIPTSLGEPYYLRTDEILSLKRLINKISRINFEKRKSFKIALSRFENSYYDIEDEDKLIDYMIAFEALFTKGKGRSQHDVIPIACSMLIGKSQKEREKIRETLDYAYTIRNAIVHGADFKEKLRGEQYFNDFVVEVEALLRRSIKELI